MLHNLNARKAVILALAIVVLMLGLYAARQLPALLAANLPNPDSYTRLVLLRDWQPDAGYQYMPRDGAPEGSYLHWSMVHSWALQQLAHGLQLARLSVDTSLLLAGAALTQASFVLLGLFAVLLVAGLGGRLAAIATALALAASPGLRGYGQLLQITHHIFMLVPLACAAWLIMAHGRSGQARSALFGAGLCLGLALWISPETMPFIVGLAGVTAGGRLQWPARAPCWPLAAGLCLMLLYGWWLDPPPPSFSAWSLDHLSLAWLSWGTLLALLLLLADYLALRPRMTLAGKLAIIGMAALGCAGLWLALTPGALHGPAGLLPDELKTLWWNHIKELRPARKPYEIIGWLLMPGLAGLLLSHDAWRRGCLWRLLLGLMALAYAGLTAWHMRMGAAAALAGVLAWGVWLSGKPAFRDKHLVRLPQAVQLRATAWLLVPALVGALTLASVWLSHNPELSAHKSCTLADIADELNALPPSTVLIALNDAPELLWRTPHRIIAGNYHHNVQGILDTYHIWRSEGDDGRARAIAHRRQLDYGLICARPDQKGEMLADRMARGETVNWLDGPRALGTWNLYAF